MNKVEIGICNPVTALQNPRDICNPAIALQNPGMKELQNRIFWKKRPKPDRPGEIKSSTIEKFPQEGRQGHLKNICKTFAKRLFFHDPSYRLKR